MTRNGLALAVGIMLWAQGAMAAEVQVDLHIPEVKADGLTGNAAVVALWVEDGRQNANLGKNLDGDALVLSQDAAATVMASVSTALRAAGFRLEPYRADAPLALLISMQGLKYSSEKGMVSSKARVSASLHASVSRQGEKTAEKTLTSSGEYSVAWRPSTAKIGEVVGETLADAVRAVLQDEQISQGLNAR